MPVTVNVTYWEGRDITTLSHEELLAAFLDLSSMYLRQLQIHREEFSNLFPQAKESNNG